MLLKFDIFFPQFLAPLVFRAPCHKQLVHGINYSHNYPKVRVSCNTSKRLPKFFQSPQNLIYVCFTTLTFPFSNFVMCGLRFLKRNLIKKIKKIQILSTPFLTIEIHNRRQSLPPHMRQLMDAFYPPKTHKANQPPMVQNYVFGRIHTNGMMCLSYPRLSSHLLWLGPFMVDSVCN